MNRNTSFWLDEMYTLGIASRHTLASALAPGMALSDPIPPLHMILLWIWIRILNPFRPFDSVWLILPSVVAIGIAIFITGLIARRVVGPGPASWIACLLCATSANWIRVGAQVRYFGLLFMVSAIVIYLFVRLRNGSPEKSSWALRIAFGVAMALAVMTGYSSVFWLVGLFLIDVFWIIRRKLSPKEFYSYAIGAILCLPWAYLVVHTILSGSGVHTLAEIWAPTPTLSLALSPYASMTTSLPIYLLYLFSIFLLIVTIAVSPATRNTTKASLNVCFILSPAIMLALLYIYSKLPVVNGSLMVTRYSYQVWPMLCVTVAQAIAIVLQTWGASRKTLRGLVILSIVFVCTVQQATSFVADMQGKPHYNISQPYASGTAFLSKRPDINNTSTVVYMSANDLPLSGWRYFYVTAQGTRPGFKVTNMIPSDANLVYVFYPTSNSWTPSAAFTAHYTMVDQYQDVHVDVYKKS